MAVIIAEQTRAILWAQWRSFVNRSPALRRSFPLTGLVMVIWYGLWGFGAITIALVAADPASMPLLVESLVPGLLIVTLYWQVIPILMASSGASLDLRRLIVYPVARRHLFNIEATLRLTSAIEMLLVITGAAIGMLMNPALRAQFRWGPAAFLPFVLFNIFLASAIRDLLGRLMARKHMRELVVIGIVLLSALPQILVHSNAVPAAGKYFRYALELQWPWASAGQFALGSAPYRNSLALLLWTTGAYLLARWQFDRTLRESPAELRAGERATARRGLAEWLYRVPAKLFRDPMGALIEKEIRTLSRSPRFRLVFVMGFTFGLLVWFPIGFRRENPNWVTDHFLTVAIAYEVLLLGEVVIWNVFGFDRRAAQLYFVVPVKLSTVLLAKNVSAAFFILLNAVLILFICALFRFSISGAMLAEALSVCTVLSIVLIAIGNMLSMRNARPVDPDQSWGRASAGRVQAVLLMIYPVVLGPIGLAFLARHAFDSEWGFYAVLGFDFAMACIVYWIAFGSALNIAQQRREELLATLAHEGGVLAN